MSDSELSADDLKALLRHIQTLEANLENWKYVQANAEYLPKEQLQHALDQLLSTLEPMVGMLRIATEMKALTTFDPIDLL